MIPTYFSCHGEKQKKKKHHGGYLLLKQKNFPICELSFQPWLLESSTNNMPSLFTFVKETVLISSTENLNNAFQQKQVISKEIFFFPSI